MTKLHTRISLKLPQREGELYREDAEELGISLNRYGREALRRFYFERRPEPIGAPVEVRSED